MLFDANPDTIAALDSIALVKLLRRLALAESRLVGIPLRGVSVPLQITIADGGEDGRVEWTGGQNSDGLPSIPLLHFPSQGTKLVREPAEKRSIKTPKEGTSCAQSGGCRGSLKKGAYIAFCANAWSPPSARSFPRQSKRR